MNPFTWMAAPKKTTARPERAYVLAPNTRQIVRNLILRADGTVLAGYRVGSARWDFTSAASKAASIQREADVYANLTGREYRQEVRVRPHPVQTWAANLDARTPNPTPDVHTCGLLMPKGDLLRGRCGCETWNNHLVRMQDAISRTGMDDKVVFRYFSLTPRLSPKTDLRKQINEFLDTNKASGPLLAVIEDEKRVADTVAAWTGTRRMSEFEQGWLRMRSLAPGVQPSGIKTSQMRGWDEQALPMLASDIRWAETPFDRSVSVTSFVGGVPVHTAVRVLSLARYADAHYPENGLPPWQIYAENVLDSNGQAFPVEWSTVGHLLGRAEMMRAADFEVKRVGHIQDDYREHGERPPAAISAAIAVATETLDQVADGHPTEASRFLGQVNVIITGQAQGNFTAEQVVEERCAAFTRLYGDSSLRMEFAGAGSQSFMLASTVPGEPVEKIAYQRRFRLPYLAAGMPHVSATVGDGAGPYLGHTRGYSARRPVQHDPHYATEGLRTGRSQNMHMAVGTLGSGKSMLFGAIAYPAVRRGIRTVISDPSGPLALLCQMPEIEAVSQEVNLLTGRRGILSPASLILNPHHADFDGDGGWADAMEQVQAERRELTVDMAMRCLPDDLVAGGEGRLTRHTLRLAARRHSDMARWEVSTTLWDLVAHLEALGSERALEVSAALREASTAPLLRLMFPIEGEIPASTVYTKTLTVITTPGITRAADGTERKDWNPSEVGADVVLRLNGLFTNRLLYSKPREERAIAMFDEAESMTDFGVGRSTLSRLGRDHSKWNMAVYLATKSINDTMLSGELKNFIASVFVGRMAGAEPAREALKLLGLDDEQYVQTLMNLSAHQPGEFVHADVDGRLGGMKVDVDFYPALRDVLLTDPAPEGSSSWDLEEERI